MKGTTNAVASSGGVESVNGQTGVVVLTKSDVGLSNVDNTSDANKPISTAVQTALNAKVNSSGWGAANSGKVLGINSSGQVVLVEVSPPVPIEQTLSSFIEITLGGSSISSSYTPYASEPIFSSGTRVGDNITCGYTGNDGAGTKQYRTNSGTNFDLTPILGTKNGYATMSFIGYTDTSTRAYSKISSVSGSVSNGILTSISSVYIPVHSNTGGNISKKIIIINLAFTES